MQNLILGSKLTGIGDFSHGDANSWQFRMQIIRKLCQVKPVQIFIEDRPEPVSHIKSDKELIVGRRYDYRNEFPLSRYTAYRIYDSVEYLEFIRFIREHKNITIIGVDDGTPKRDRNMARRILDQLRSDSINLFLAHNGHVDYVNCDTSAGHYLLKALGNHSDGYQHIITAAFGGMVRYDGVLDARGKPDIWKEPAAKRWPDLKDHITGGFMKLPRSQYVYVVGWAYERHGKELYAPDYLKVFPRAIPLTNIS